MSVYYNNKTPSRSRHVNGRAPQRVYAVIIKHEGIIIMYTGNDIVSSLVIMRDKYLEYFREFE